MLMSLFEMLHTAPDAEQLLLVRRGSGLEEIALQMGKRRGYSVASLDWKDRENPLPRTFEIPNSVKVQRGLDQFSFSYSLAPGLYLTGRGSNPKVGKRPFADSAALNLEVKLPCINSGGRVVLRKFEVDSTKKFKTSTLGRNGIIQASFYGDLIVTLSKLFDAHSTQEWFRIWQEMGNDVKNVCTLGSKEAFPIADYFPPLFGKTAHVSVQDEYVLGRIPYDIPSMVRSMSQREMSWQRKPKKKACVLMVGEKRVPTQPRDQFLLDRDGSFRTLLAGDVEIRAAYTRSEVKKILTEYDIIALHGHTSWYDFRLICGTPEVSRERFRLIDIPRLPRHPLVIAATCFGGKTWGQAFLQKGAVAFVGTDDLYQNPDSQYSISNFETLGDFVRQINWDNSGLMFPMYVVGNPALRLN